MAPSAPRFKERPFIRRMGSSGCRRPWRVSSHHYLAPPPFAWATTR
jgi:hypothetical protein